MLKIYEIKLRFWWEPSVLLLWAEFFISNSIYYNWYLLHSGYRSVDSILTRFLEFCDTDRRKNRNIQDFLKNFHNPSSYCFDTISQYWFRKWIFPFEKKFWMVIMLVFIITINECGQETNPKDSFITERNGSQPTKDK